MSRRPRCARGWTPGCSWTSATASHSGTGCSARSCTAACCPASGQRSTPSSRGVLDDPAQRAHHSYRAGLRELALAASLEAAEDATAVFAYDAALLHYERALELGERTSERLARAAQAARHAGASERAVTLCREAIERTDDPARQAQLYERLGEFHFWDDEIALECYDRALALAPGESPVARRARPRADGAAALGGVPRVL